MKRILIPILAVLGVAQAAEVVERKTLTLDGAQRAIAAAVAQAHRNHSGGVIAVVDDGRNLMALERVDGTFAAGAHGVLSATAPAAVALWPAGRQGETKLQPGFRSLTVRRYRNPYLTRCCERISHFQDHRHVAAWLHSARNLHVHLNQTRDLSGYAAGVLQYRRYSSAPE
jgi:hypothetical protein